jgi:MFS family permease
MSNGGAGTQTVESQVPSRIDRLPFSRWHWLVITALGITWILDGLEVTMVGNIAAVLTDPKSGLGLSEGQIGTAGGIYIAGACAGALFFSYLTDRFGRKKLFLITLGIYLVFTIATAFSWNFWSFVVFRFFTGAGIGGEYSAIYSAIDELIPARIRGRVALAISGSYWAGAALGSLVAVFLLNAAFLSLFYSWRVAFLVGAVLGIGVLLIRRYVPESPRWLATHGRNEQAEEVAGGIEEKVKEHSDTDKLPPVDEDETITIEQRKSIGFTPIFRAMFQMYPKRTVLGLVLMGTQAFLYNAVLFTYGLILSNYYDVPGENVGYYIAVLAIGNLTGPLLLGRFFDRIGRVPMISGCYITSGVLLAASGYLFHQQILTGVTLTAIWVAMFFFASSAASAAYLTVSEVFPMEIRAMAIAAFYAIATGIGGITGPIVFGQLIGTGNRSNLLIGFGIAAGLMIAAAVAELVLGVRAEQRSLEDVATPLTAIQEETGSSA